MDSEVANGDYFSDPHLVFKDNRIECFYRISNYDKDGCHVKLLRRTTSDGVNWSSRETILDLDSSLTQHSIGDMLRSQAILWSGNEYLMWYTDQIDAHSQKNLCFTSSCDGIHWEEKQICELIGIPINPWHIDVTQINGEYILTVYDFNNLTIWSGNSTTSFNYKRTILEPTKKYGSFYSDGLYRTSLVQDDNVLRLYFSAYDQKSTYIGLMEGTEINNLSVQSIDGSKYTFVSFFEPYILNWKKRIITLYRSFIDNYY